MEYTLTEAAQATGLSRPTIFRAIKKGTLSARREEDNSYRIDASELARVYPLVTMKQADMTARHDLKRHEMHEMPGASDTELALLRLELRMIKDQLARERELRDQERDGVDRERDASRETVDDLRKRLDRSEERVLALSAQVAQPAPQMPQERVVEVPVVAEPSKGTKGFLARLLGL